MSSREMARLTFGNPGFFDFIAKGFKTVAPALSFGASFIPGVGPLLGKAIDAAAGLVADDSGGDSNTRLDSDGDDD
jgi:hypothetical protein